MKKNTLALLMVTSLGLFTTNSFAAGSATGSLQVKVNVQSSCVLNTATVGGTTATQALLDFGTITHLAADIKANTSTSGQGLTVLCSPNTAWSLNFDGGNNLSSSQRRMSDTTKSNYIAYNLYADSGYAKAVPVNSSTTDATGAVFTGTGTGAAQNVIVYGKIPATGTIPVPGSYSDTVTVYVIF
ncbi:spore coat U domain-containing protein [Rosenbergiella nectarea]|uniref:Csu type fimbrial protein n=1 Tax=Rosenbergiella nectarea TaxID=988801 RepID=UPI001F4D7666|nr:spore coat U domain-containing protein [Rosenbergiella nectarea]